MSQQNYVYEHAWKYFELHSNQRITVFNFFLGIVGLVTAGIGLSLQQGGGFIYIGTMLGLFLSVISFIFWKLDQRASSLIKASETTLIEIEKGFECNTGKLFTMDKENKNINRNFLSEWSYGRCLRIAFSIVGSSGILLCLISQCIKFK